ncbi:MAG: KH domain-containing protein, partial [Thermoplasmata archaeon]
AALRARDVVLAIGRGVSPDRADHLLAEGTYLAVLDMKETTGKRSQEALRRIRARIIGREGRARRRIEELSGCSVSVYGRTVALIGEGPQIERGRRAVILLLRGSEHSTVFRMLAHGRRDDALADALGSGPEPGGP